MAVAEEKETILQFIQDYKNHELLWDQNHPNYKDQSCRYEALTSLGEKYNLDLKTVKTKIKNLRSYFSREHQRVISHKRANGGEGKKSGWFAYNALTFILDSGPNKDPEQIFVSEVPVEIATEEESDDSHTAPIIDFTPPLHRKRNRSSKKEPEEQEDAPTKRSKLLDKNNRDECTIFGELVENKLRNLSKRNRIVAQRRVCEIFFDLEMEELDNINNVPEIEEKGMCSEGFKTELT